MVLYTEARNSILIGSPYDPRLKPIGTMNTVKTMMAVAALALASGHNLRMLLALANRGRKSTPRSWFFVTLGQDKSYQRSPLKLSRRGRGLPTL
jgi:hypothetical protein